MSGQQPVIAKAVDLTVRYGERFDPADPFAELTGPVEGIVPVAAAAFPQLPGGLNALLGVANGELPQHDDAFQLRVQVPANVQGAPVLVFVPGGGFTTGTGNARWFDSAAYAERTGTIVVTVNYRLGVTGHFGPAGDAAESQRGLRDLVVALQWIAAHIGELGGNADQVTLAGDSAGAWYCYALATLAETRGLVCRLALISLPWEPPLSATAYANRREELLSFLPGALTETSVPDRLAAQRSLAQLYQGKGMPILPAVAGEITTDLHDFSASAARLHVEALALLATTEEFNAFVFPAPDTAFSDAQAAGVTAQKFADPAAVVAWTDAKWGNPTPKQRFVETLTLHQFRLANLALANAATAAGVKVTLGLFSVQSELPGAYSPHCFTLPFLFGDEQSWADAPILAGFAPQLRERVTNDVRDWLTGFVHAGVRHAFDPASPMRLEFSGAGTTLSAPAEAGLQPRY